MKSSYLTELQRLWCGWLGLVLVAVPAGADLKPDSSASHSVAIVIGAKAPALERYAADELCSYLEKLFDIHTTPTEKIQDNVEAVILIGSPTTNAAVAKALGFDSWPKVTDQGLVLKRSSLDGKPVLIVGGGSPKATLWAVYELVERWGVRYLLHGDVYPDDAGKFRLPEKGMVREPLLRIRQWRVVNCFLCGPESWGIADYRPVIDQLAKLRFNRLLVYIWPFQPFLHLEHKGVARNSAWLSFGHKFPITNDMVGRRLFDDRSQFWNRDLPLGGSYEESAAAGEKLIHNLMALAHERGMECTMPVHLTDFPPEFRELPGQWEPVHQLAELTIVPGPSTPPDDPVLTELAVAVLQTTVNTYPEVDYLALGMPEHRQWAETYEQAWQELDAKYEMTQITSLPEVIAAAGKRPGVPGGTERAVREAKGDIVMLRFYDRLLRESRALANTKRPNLRFVYTGVAEELFPFLSRILPPGSETLNQIAYTPARVLQRREAIAMLDTEEVPATLIYTLHDDNVGLLPALTTGSLHELTKDLRQHGWAGFSTRYWQIGDHDPCVAYLARASWDGTVSPESVYRDQILATCGEAAVEDMLTMFRELEETSVLLEWHALGLAFPRPGMIMKHWQAEPMPEMYTKAREGYQRALTATIRAHEKTPNEKRAYVDYWIGRLEFGIGYFDTIEAVHRAATAEQASESTEAHKLAQEAVAKARTALEAYARVARDQSDRGAIATMNEYVYRPLKAKAQQLSNK